VTDQRRRFEGAALPHLGAAYNLARWLSGSASEADDIVQEAMLRAYLAFDGLRGVDVRPWLLAIVRNCFRTAAVRNARLVYGLEAPEAAGPGDGAGGVPEDEPLAAAMRAESAGVLDRAIAALPLDYREVLILREFEDLSYGEIATLIGTPIGTVMSRLSRARTALRAALTAAQRGAVHDL
jgi:RNA polymerase sigma-70 factor (ECF subfamily)